MFQPAVLAWRLSITLGAEFCLDAVNEALARHGKPASTDQGSQFTSAVFTELLLEKQIAISMVGRGAWQRVRRADVAADEIRGGLPTHL